MDSCVIKPAPLLALQPGCLHVFGCGLMPTGTVVVDGSIYHHLQGNSSGWFQPPDYEGPNMPYDTIWVQHIVKGLVVGKRSKPDPPNKNWPPFPSFISKHNNTFYRTGLLWLFPTQLDSSRQSCNPGSIWSFLMLKAMKQMQHQNITTVATQQHPRPTKKKTLTVTTVATLMMTHFILDSINKASFSCGNKDETKLVSLVNGRCHCNERRRHNNITLLLNTHDTLFLTCFTPQNKYTFAVDCCLNLQLFPFIQLLLQSSLGWWCDLYNKQTISYPSIKTISTSIFLLF
jgi:hypothetical protein